MPDLNLRAPKFRDFYINRFYQTLSEIHTTPQPNPIFSLAKTENRFFLFLLPFSSCRPSLSLLALSRQQFSVTSTTSRRQKKIPKPDDKLVFSVAWQCRNGCLSIHVPWFEPCSERSEHGPGFLSKPNLDL